MHQVAILVYAQTPKVNCIDTGMMFVNFGVNKINSFSTEAVLNLRTKWRSGNHLVLQKNNMFPYLNSIVPRMMPTKFRFSWLKGFQTEAVWCLGRVSANLLAAILIIEFIVATSVSQTWKFGLVVDDVCQVSNQSLHRFPRRRFFSRKCVRAPSWLTQEHNFFASELYSTRDDTC